MATNVYLKIETPEIKGESTDDKHKDQIEVLSWSHGFNQPTSPVRSSAGSGTVERANHQDFTFTKYTDISSPQLMKKCWSGQHFGKMTLQAYRSADEKTVVEYLRIEFEDVVISNISIGGGMGDVPIENISLAYGKVTYTYQPADEKTAMSTGNASASHDLKSNEIA
jgi:type VI secretion system secreted protein Hcp